MLPAVRYRVWADTTTGLLECQPDPSGEWVLYEEHLIVATDLKTRLIDETRIRQHWADRYKALRSRIIAAIGDEHA